MTRQPIKLSFATGAALILAMAAALSIAYTGQELARYANRSISEARALSLLCAPIPARSRIKSWKRRKAEAGSGILSI